MFGKLLGTLLATLLLASGCSSTDQEHREIREALATRAKALNARDLPQYISVVSPHFNDKGKNFAQLKASLENNFRDYEQISFKEDTPTITIDGTRALAIASYRMNVKVRGNEMALNGTEHLRLAKEPGGWKIIAGI